MNILLAFNKAFARKEREHWDKIYVLVDIHDTIFESSYSDDEQFIVNPGAIEALQMMTLSKEISLILWTSTYEEKTKVYIDYLSKYNIHFDMINENTEVSNTSLGCFDKKLYFNIGIDDKFGFDASQDWKMISLFLLHRYMTNKDLYM